MAFAKAEVSYSKVRAMTRIATPESEGRLLHMAKNATASQLETICRGVEQVTGKTPAGQSRWLTVRPCKDGMVRLEARLDPDEAALILKAVEAAIEDASAEALPRSEARPEGLVRLAESFLVGQRAEGRPGGERHQLLVCVREDPLHSGGVSAQVEGVGQVAPETLRRLARDASLTRVVVDEEGTPLDVGRKPRTVPPAMRRALVRRARTTSSSCPWPTIDSCTRAAFGSAGMRPTRASSGPMARRSSCHRARPDCQPCRRRVHILARR